MATIWKTDSNIVTFPQNLNDIYFFTKQKGDFIDVAGFQLDILLQKPVGPKLIKETYFTIFFFLGKNLSEMFPKNVWIVPNTSILWHKII